MLKTLAQLKNIKGKRVLVRADFNVPLNKKGVADDTRIKETLPTLKFLLKKKAKVIVMMHLGRPEGKVVASLKVDPIGKRLSALLRKKVTKLNDCIGPNIEQHIKNMKEGDIVLLENVRFHAEEERCEPKFTKALASLGDLYVNDGFGASYRRHSSTAGITDYIPGYAGFLVEREIKNLSPLLKNPPKKLTLIVGGAKVDTKIGVLKNFFGKAEYILIGGALANTFLAAQGYDIGKSFYEPQKIEIARELLMLAEKMGQKLVLPVDVIVADEAGEKVTALDLPIEDMLGGMKALDIGKKTRARFIEIIKNSKAVIWNGPMGLSELTPFAGGTQAVAQALKAIKKRAKTYIGGGDTIDALKRCKVQEKDITFISTGGGAMLEFLEGKKLPGIEVLIS